MKYVLAVSCGAGSVNDGCSESEVRVGMWV